MNFLLDTHIWLWSLLEPGRLAPQVVEAISADDARRWLSPLSVWESLLLIERKRLVVDADAHDWVREALSVAPVEEAPVTIEVAFASRTLASKHQDPVDRFLAATAQVFDLTLVTADRQLFRLPGVRVLKNVPGPGRRPRRPGGRSPQHVRAPR